MNKNRMIYGVYENDEFEECVYVGTVEEIAIEFCVRKDTIYNIVARDGLLNWKYRIKKVGYENEIEKEI